MKTTILAQQAIPSTRENSLPIHGKYVDDSKLNTEEPRIDCSDCFDTMIKIYDSDKILYQCKNCDLVIPGNESATIFMNNVFSCCGGSSLLGTIRYILPSPSVWSSI